MKHVVREARSHAHGRSGAKRGTGRGNGPVRIIVPHPLAWHAASLLAGGNVRRLFTVPDGVIVANTSTRPKWVA